MKDLTYEQAIKRLEEVVALLEKGDIPLTDSLKLFEEGVQLSEFCRKTLESAKQKIISLDEVKDNE